jgi:tetratricopeptide (TPR) repeat protein
MSRYNLAKSKLIRSKDYNFYFNTALQYVRQEGEMSYNAVVNFEQAIKINPNYGGIYSDLGNCYRGGFKCYHKAEYYYTKAIENGFSKGFVYYNRAICNYELNNLEKMSEDLQMSRNLGWHNDYYKLAEKEKEANTRKLSRNNENKNEEIKSNTERNSLDFKIFLKYFLNQTFSGKNFDSLVYVSSPLLAEFVNTDFIGLGRFWNMGVACTLYEADQFGYNFYEGYFGSIQPETSALIYFSNKTPDGGFCDEAISPDGIYYKQVSELPTDWDPVDGTIIPSPNKYKNLKKMKVEIQYEKTIIKILYFIEYKNKWHLLYIYDCDCSA